MLSRRTVLDLLAFCAFVTAADAEPAKKKQESGKKHQHKNGHNLLGAKSGRTATQIDTAGQATVSAEVNNGKVTGCRRATHRKGTCRRAK